MFPFFNPSLCIDSILYKNCFFGTIPREIEGLTQLKLLDLRENNLSGTIPTEISRIINLKYL